MIIVSSEHADKIRCLGFHALLNTQKTDKAGLASFLLHPCRNRASLRSPDNGRSSDGLASAHAPGWCICVRAAGRRARPPAHQRCAQALLHRHGGPCLRAQTQARRCAHVHSMCMARTRHARVTCMHMHTCAWHAHTHTRARAPCAWHSMCMAAELPSPCLQAGTANLRFKAREPARESVVVRSPTPMPRGCGPVHSMSRGVEAGC